jgi:hypothetical protein
LSKFYAKGKQGPRVKEISEVAASKAVEVAKDFQISPSLTPRIAQLAFYNFIISCGTPPHPFSPSRPLHLFSFYLFFFFFFFFLFVKDHVSWVLPLISSTAN